MSFGAADEIAQRELHREIERGVVVLHAVYGQSRIDDFVLRGEAHAQRNAVGGEHVLASDSDERRSHNELANLVDGR
jgi:hypothetical protein